MIRGDYSRVSTFGALDHCAQLRNLGDAFICRPYGFFDSAITFWRMATSSRTAGLAGLYEAFISK
jgi:hypothetical protein